jgi:hypothetical protein
VRLCTRVCIRCSGICSTAGARCTAEPGSKLPAQAVP